VRIEQVIQETRFRLRLLRAVRWGSWSLVWTLLLSALYVGLSSLHWVSDALVPWLVWLNLAAALSSAVAGMMWRVDTQRMLFELDRRLQTGELLLTLESLKQLRRKHDFVPILEDQLIRMKVRPQEVYHLDVSDLRRGGGIAALAALVLAWLWLGPFLLQWVGLNAGLLAGQSGVDMEKLTMQDLPPELQQEWEELRDVLEYFGYQGGGENPDGAIEEGDRDQLIQLFDDLDRAQDQLLGLNRSNAPSADPAADQARREQRERLEQLQQQLEKAIEQAQAGQSPSPEQREQLEQALETLPQEDPLRQQIEQALQQQNPQQQQQALQQAQEQLNDRLENEQQAQALRDSVQDWAEQEGDPYSPEDLSDFQPNDPSGASNVENDGQASGQGDPQGEPGSSKAQQAVEDQESKDGQRSDDGQDLQQGGEEGGTGPDTSSGPDVFGDDEWNPQYRNATIPSELLPADAVQEWLSRGVPVESTVEAGQQEQFRLSYDQVEALLDLRDLPADVRDVVRLYFLQLIGQLNEAQPAD